MPYNLSPTTYHLLPIFLAYILDLIFGDPQWQWHPVRFIGRLIGHLENRLNTCLGYPAVTRFRGLMLAVIVVGITLFYVWGVLKLSYFIHPVFYYLAFVLFIYFALSIKALAQETNKVKKALIDRNVFEARKNLSFIVGRDTQNLDEPQIIRATLETVAESITDGIIAPLFYAFLGGAVLAWGYKAINTLDSMVGYRNDRFIYFGWAAAKIDAWLNFIPAKLTCVSILFSSICLGKYWINSGKCFLKYLFKGPRYNSEAAEAVMAGALGVQLGGLNFYSGLPIQKAIIGEGIFPLEIKHIKEAISITYLSSALFVATGIYLIWLLGGR